MPIINVRNGDLLDLFKQKEFTAIAHGCNCFHTMGAGIAGQIAKKFPNSLVVDKQTPRGYLPKLGRYSEAETEFGLILNLYTQYLPGVEETTTLYSSIRRVFGRLNHDFNENKNFHLGIPKIGCGIAGGDWNNVSDIINDCTPQINICVVEFHKNNPWDV